MILSSMQETTASGNKALGLIFAITTVFSQFFGVDSSWLEDAPCEPGKPRRR
jgi:hypothetical protein